MLTWGLVVNISKVYVGCREGGSRYSGVEPLVLFSGDAFNPSIMSTVTKGKQMVPVLNGIGVHTACYGDFDLGT